MITHFLINSKNKKSKLHYLNNISINKIGKPNNAKSNNAKSNNNSKNIITLENNESCIIQHQHDNDNDCCQNENINLPSDALISNDKLNIYLHNIYGLGDSVFNMIFFHLIKEYIINNKIQIFYFTKKEYIHQLNDFNNTSNVIILPLDKKPNNSIELWINNEYFSYTYTDFYDNNKKINGRVNYNGYYLHFFNNVLHKLNFKTSISSILYSDNDLFYRFTKIPSEYKNFDILILNSQPFSGQYEYKKHIWDKYIQILNSRFKILTTTKVNGVLCTFDKRLSVKDIASLSMNAKVIIFINSGVFPGLLNNKTIKTVKQFYVFDNKCYYSYPNFKNKNCITEITFNELNYYVTLK